MGSPSDTDGVRACCVIWYGMVQYRHIIGEEKGHKETRIYERGFSYSVYREPSVQKGGRVANLLLLPQREETDTRYLHNLETYTGDITLCLTTATETGDKDFVVLIDEVEATVVL
jgi:hypothetical protein